MSKHILPRAAGEMGPTVRAKTFGMEFEYVLAFREDLLKHTISKYSLEAEIVKMLADSDHRQMMTTTHAEPIASHQCRTHWP
jgi:hypothetical protein